ncbi:MAG TPA: NUDIX domain-containing protein [Herpetosiphonaceae bacterium]
MPREYPTSPLIGVGAVIWRADRVLLIRRGKPPRENEWSLPGGRQELGETVAEAARREAREETGLAITVRDVVAVVDLIDRDADGRVQFHYTLIDVLAEWQSGEAVAADDAAEVAWVTLDELPRYSLWSETERVIRLADERRKATQYAD